MADFTAVIQRAVDGLSDKSPEMRAKVYEKAKTAVQRQLNAMNPPPTEETMARQMEKLDAAIAAIEADFAAAEAQAPAVEEAAPTETPQEEPEAQPVEGETEEAPQPAPSDEPEADAGEQEQPQADEAPEETAEESEEPADAPEPSYEEQAWEEPPHVEPEMADDTPVEEDTPAEPEEAWQDPVTPETPQPDDTLDEPAFAEEADTVAESDVPDVEHHWESHEEDEPAAPLPATSTDDLVWESQDQDEVAEVAPDSELVWDEPQEAGELEKAVEDNAGVPFFEQQEPAFEEEPVEPAFDDSSAFTTGSRETLEANEWELPSIEDGADDAFSDDLDDRIDDLSTDETLATGASLEEPLHVEADISEPPLDEPEVPQQSGPEQPAQRPDIDHIIAGLEVPSVREGGSGLIRTVIIGILALVIVAGLGFAGWQYRTEIASLFDSTTTDIATTENGGDDGLVGDEEESAQAPATTEEEAADTGPEKFTQRLMPDGTEVEGEPGPAATGDAEGKSVAQLEGAEDTGTDQQSASTTPPGAEAMFLYEERLGQASPTALEGSIVWSRQMETQDVGNPQPVIQAKIDIPERSLSALLTIKRNLDPSLPASHIVELVFSLPDNFEGGGIDSVVRISMKQNEQDQGQPLIGVPAAITDYFHMIALNSLPEAESTNLRLLREREWFDIPLVYGNGRRALMALEKGPDGKAVFDQVMREWEQASSNP